MLIITVSGVIGECRGRRVAMGRWIRAVMLASVASTCAVSFPVDAQALTSCDVTKLESDWLKLRGGGKLALQNIYVSLNAAFGKLRSSDDQAYAPAEFTDDPG